MKYKKTIVVSIFLLIFMPSFLWAEEPGKIIMETVDRGLAILKDPSLQGEKKTEDYRQKLWEEISPIFNFEEMSKRALARHWRKLSPEEKSEFVKLFTDHLRSAYIGKAFTYSGEKIVYLREKQDNNYAKVQTKVILNTGKGMLVDFNMHNNHGKWKIYDVIIEGVSLVNNYRSQFNSFLINSSYEELIQKIKEKIQGMNINK
ncbi:MAG: phospholipid-binding protein MlaC [Candidatus Scalinduaceae bacterium]